jgi:hypothetical protein
MDVADHNHLPLRDTTPAHLCTNCGAPLHGRYCSSCGQRAGTAAHTVGHFLREAIEAFTHADSRLWSTLKALLRRPGFLTREYFAGRRARYLPPLRLYLIMSVLFFVLNALLSAGPSQHPAVMLDKSATTQDCEHLKADLGWGGQVFLPRLKAACKSMQADNGRAFSESLVNNLGRALFVFLPLMAALMKLLYWRPPRYYLEHLLLLLNNHACVFLLLSIFMLATHWIPYKAWNALLVVGLIWYLPRYLYRSMKVVYGQAGWLTFLKFTVLAFAYLMCGSFMLLATAFVSAATL